MQCNNQGIILYEIRARINVIQQIFCCKQWDQYKNLKNYSLVTSFLSEKLYSTSTFKLVKIFWICCQGTRVSWNVLSKFGKNYIACDYNSFKELPEDVKKWLQSDCLIIEQKDYQFVLLLSIIPYQCPELLAFHVMRFFLLSLPQCVARNYNPLI